MSIIVSDLNKADQLEQQKQQQEGKEGMFPPISNKY